MSVVNDLGILALASRLERLSETLKKDSAAIFKKYQGDLKYKWYPVLFVIYKKPGIGIVELAEELSYAHPSVIQLISEVMEVKLVKSSEDIKDKRKRKLELTAKGKEMIAEVLPFTAAFKKTLLDIDKGDPSLMKAIEKLEEKLEEVSFYKRVEKTLEKTNKPRLASV